MPSLVLPLPQSIVPSASVGLTALCFFLAILLLDAFDISLPRGDTIGVSGALSAAGVVILGPAWAALVCIGSALATRLARHGADRHRLVVGAVLIRFAALSASVFTVLALSLNPDLYHSQSGIALVAAAFLLTELVAAQFVAAVRTGRPFGRLVRGNLQVQAPLLIAQWCASVLLMITFGGMGAWSLIPVVALLFLMRQSYAMLQDIRELYRTTVEVLVEAAEGQDRRRVGHAERTAAVARNVATSIGLAPSRVERISYAALLHDVDAIGDSAELVTDSDSDQVPSVGSSSAVFEGVHFFDDVLPIIRVCDGVFSAQSPPTESDLLSGLIVALASDADAAEHEDVRDAHLGNSIDRVSPSASASMKSLVVGAALALGYRIPAVS